MKDEDVYKELKKLAVAVNLPIRFAYDEIWLGNDYHFYGFEDPDFPIRMHLELDSIAKER